jgi:hypothetical protein
MRKIILRFPTQQNDPVPGNGTPFISDVIPEDGIFVIQFPNLLYLRLSRRSNIITTFPNTVKGFYLLYKLVFIFCFDLSSPLPIFDIFKLGIYL